MKLLVFDLPPELCQGCSCRSRRLIPYAAHTWLCCQCFGLWVTLHAWSIRVGRSVRERRVLLA